MQCITCGGKGCDECKNGNIEITDCPLKIITPDIWEIIEYAELYEKGIPPLAGGALDQIKNFTDACRMIFQEQNYWKKKLGILN